MVKPQLYRKAALDELSSPEQRDVLLKITPPPKGAVIVAVAAPILAVVVVLLLGAGG